MTRIDNLSQLRDRDVEHNSERFLHLDQALQSQGTELAASRADLVEQIQALDSKILRSFGGDESGRSLDETWWGLMVTIVGTGLQLVGSVVG